MADLPREESSPNVTARRVPAWATPAALGGLLLVLLGMYPIAASGPPVDFGAYYGAAVAIRSGANPYADALAWKAAGHATGSLGSPPAASIAYVYPPGLALALLPLTLLPMPLASALWVLLLFGCVVGTAWCLATLLVGRQSEAFWLLVAALAIAIVTLKPVRGALTFSKQVDPLILLLLAATILAYARRRDGLAGIAFGLAIAIKPFLVVLALVPIWQGAYRMVTVAGLLSAGLTIGPLLALGLLDSFVQAASHWGGPVMAASPVGQSVYSLLLRTLTVQPYTVPLVDAPELVAPLLALAGLGLAGTVLRTVPRSRDRSPLAQVLQWGLAIAAMSIFGPLTEEHHLAYLAIGLSGTVAAGLTRWRTSALARGLVVFGLLLVCVLLLPGTQRIAWGFYAYKQAPMAPPLAWATFFWLAVMLLVGTANLLALRLLRSWPAPALTSGPTTNG